METPTMRVRLSMRLGASIAAVFGYLAVACAGAAGLVGEPQRVADINPGAGGSSPFRSVTFGRSLIFRAGNPSVGDEAWVTDGTGAGTIPLEVNPGPLGSSAGSFTPIGDEVLFNAFGEGGDELWRTDGTVPGTSRVLDINPGPGDSSPRALIAVGEQAVFRADDGVAGDEPWRSDGTAAGTVRIADVNPGPANGAGGFFFPEVLGSSVIFRGSEPVAGSELWRLPVTGSGAELVANINLGGSSDPLELVPLGDRVLFSADDGVTGRELWSSDGLPGGDYHLVDDFDGAATDSGVMFLTRFGSHVYFAVAGDPNGVELWRSDGTTAEIASDVNAVGNSNPQDLRAIGDRLYFTAVRGAFSREVFWTDGIPGGTTQMLGDINPTGTSACGFPEFTGLNGLVYFCATDGSSGFELWRTDGTPAGTSRVADLNPGPGGSDPTDLTVLGDTLYFSANDGTSGQELWALDTGRPDTVIDAGPEPGEHVSDSTPALQLSSPAIDVDRFECSTDGDGGYATCAGRDGTGQPERLKDGRHTISVRAVDVRDNPDESPAERTFTVDTKGPKVTVKSAALDGAALRLKAKCKRSELSGPCRGKVVLKTTKGKAKVAKRKFKLKPGKSKRLKLKLKPSKLELLEGSGAVKAKGKVRDRLGNKGRVRSKKLKVRTPQP